MEFPACLAGEGREPTIIECPRRSDPTGDRQDKEHEKHAMAAAAVIQDTAIQEADASRKARCALKGLVKLHAMMRGHLVRKRATDTLRCMQVLVTAQARARTQRIKMAEDSKPIIQVA